MSTVGYPQGNVLLRTLTRDLPIVSHGEGIYLFDRRGRRYVDASSGALVASVGHGNRRVADAVHAQLCRVGYVNGTQLTSEPTEALATRLTTLATRELPEASLERVAFLCSGSEVVEAALKFARQLWVERGEPLRTKIVARTPSYHGNTLYALSVSGRPHYKELFGPMLSPVVTVPAPSPTRSGLACYARDGAAHYASALEEIFAREEASTIAALIVEPVIGSSAGAAVPPPGYFERVREICDRHGVLIVADEVLSGVGRCGAFFASSLVGLRPDVVVLGKGLGGGYAPVSALMVRGDHLAELRRGSGFFRHAQTYLHAPFLTAAGLAVLDEIEQGDLLANARTMGARLLAALHERITHLPWIGSVQGIGLLVGVDLVADRITQVPFGRSRKVVERLVAHLFERGLIVWPNTGHVDGVDGDLFLLGPPLVIEASEVDALVDTLSAALEDFIP